MGYETKQQEKRRTYLFSKGNKKELDFFFKITSVLNFEVSVLCTDWYMNSNSNREDK